MDKYTGYCCFQISQNIILETQGRVSLYFQVYCRVFNFCKVGSVGLLASNHKCIDCMLFLCCLSIFVCVLVFTCVCLSSTCEFPVRLSVRFLPVQLLQQNFNRVKRCILVLINAGYYANSCLEWESPQRSICAFLVSVCPIPASSAPNLSHPQNLIRGCAGHWEAPFPWSLEALIVLKFIIVPFENWLSICIVP